MAGIVLEISRLHYLQPYQLVVNFAPDRPRYERYRSRDGHYRFGHRRDKWVAGANDVVWISALQFAKRRGTPTLAPEKAMSEDVITTCDEIDAEIVRVLTEKFSWEQTRATSVLQAILARGIRVKIRGTVKVSRDSYDDMFLECAALAQADLLIAGDKDLLALVSYKGRRIVTPSEYLRAG
jgi:putative PIN family toxin of toxin-antitoxin system